MLVCPHCVSGFYQALSCRLLQHLLFIRTVGRQGHTYLAFQMYRSCPSMDSYCKGWSEVHLPLRKAPKASPHSMRAVGRCRREGLVGLDTLPLVTTAVLQSGFASAHLSQPFPVTGVCNTPAGLEEVDRNLLLLSIQRSGGPWAMQSHLVPWHCSRRGPWQLLVGHRGSWCLGCSGSRWEKTFAHVENASVGGVEAVGVLHPSVTAWMLWVTPWVFSAAWPFRDGKAAGNNKPCP